MATYIFFWNPDISNVKCVDYIEEYFTEEGFFNWSINEYEKVKEGDTFYMMICGSINAVVAKGKIISPAYEARDWSPKRRKPIYYVDMATRVAINTFDTDKLLTGEMLSKEIPVFNWTGGHSGRLLNEDDGKKLDSLFEQYVENHRELIDEGLMWEV